MAGKTKTIITAGHGRPAVLLELDERTMTVDDWDQLYLAFLKGAKLRWVRSQRPYCQAYNLDKDCSLGPVAWHEEVASARGASFILFPMEGATSDDIKRCKHHIQSNRDVVSLRCYEPSKLLDPAKVMATYQHYRKV